MRGDMTPREERIRERAERLWEEASKPEGRDDDIFAGIPGVGWRYILVDLMSRIKRRVV